MDTIHWFESYLKNRSQKCTVNGITSSCLGIKCGVPQGSILGPMLFLLYINDIVDTLVCTKCYLYADDTVLYMSNPNETVAHAGWCDINQLTNTKKTKVVLFGMRNMLKRASVYDTCINYNMLNISLIWESNLIVNLILNRMLLNALD